MDVRRNGMLNARQFVLAMVLIQKKINNTLPPNLTSLSPRLTSSLFENSNTPPSTITTTPSFLLASAASTSFFNKDKSINSAALAPPTINLPPAPTNAYRSHTTNDTPIFVSAPFGTTTPLQHPHHSQKNLSDPQPTSAFSSRPDHDSSILSKLADSHNLSNNIANTRYLSTPSSLNVSVDSAASVVEKPTVAPTSNSLIEGSASTFSISADDRKTFYSYFKQLDSQQRGFLLGLLNCTTRTFMLDAVGESAAAFFKKSDLPDATLSRVWELADYDNQGCLDNQKFAIAMFLIQKCIRGTPLPSSLPPQLKPSTPGRPTFTPQHFN